MKQSEVKRIAVAPERVWLQVGDDVVNDEVMREVDWDTDDVTWCRDKIHDTDIEYVRVDRCRRKS